MKINLILFIAVIIQTIIGINAEIKKYEGYKVYDVVPRTTDQVNVVEGLNALGIFLIEKVNTNLVSKIMVPKEKQSEFLSRLAKSDIEVNEVVSDLQREMDNTFKIATPTSRSVETFYSMAWDRYHNLDDIYIWFDTLTKNYPDKVKTVVLGHTFEKREVKGIVINQYFNKKKRIIGVIEAGLHAKEWIGPAIATWIIKELLSSNDSNIRTLAENFEWHILPVTNPDGYAYTFSSERFWRKNRNPKYNSSCTNSSEKFAGGVDLNINFNVQWGASGIAVYNDSCSEYYPGPNSFSESESTAIASYLKNIRGTGKIIYYISIHSTWWAPQFVLLPYGYLRVPIDDQLRPANYDAMHKIAVNAAEKMQQRYGTVSKVGVPDEVVYTRYWPGDGASCDWAVKRLDVGFSCYLLLERHSLPPEEIIPKCEEVMDFFVEMDRSARNLSLYEPIQRLHRLQGLTTVSEFEDDLSFSNSIVWNYFLSLFSYLLVLIM